MPDRNELTENYKYAKYGMEAVYLEFPYGGINRLDAAEVLKKELYDQQLQIFLAFRNTIDLWNKKKVDRALILDMLDAFIDLEGAFCTYAACVPELDKNVQRIIDEGRIKDKLIGMQLSVICKGESIPHDFVSGKTNEDGNAPVTTDTLFQIGSLTKSFTASLILKLEADGILSINDEIGIWLPQIPDAWKKIAIKQLLNHSSGIKDYTLTTEFQLAEFLSKGQKHWQQNELLQFVANVPVEFPAGKGFDYSNTNYVLAGMIIDAALVSQGKSYADATKNQLIDPLHLANTFYLPQSYNQEISARMAHGYYQFDHNLPEIIDVTSYDMSFVNTTGANVSTAHDVSIWFQNLMHGNIFPVAQLAEMMSMIDMETGQPVQSNGYGLGIYQYNFFDPNQKEVMWQHMGETLAYHSAMFWLPCRDVVVAYTSNLNTADSDITPAGVFIAQQVISFIQKADPDKRCQIPTSVKETLSSKIHDGIMLNPMNHLAR